MGAAALPLAVMGTAQSAMGSYQQTATQKWALANQATIAGWQANQALTVGQNQAQVAGMKEAQVMGSQRANMAANGVQLGSGSATDVLAGTKYMGMRDQLTIMDNATRTAWAYQNQSNMEGALANNMNPASSALTSLMGGAGQVANIWNKKNTGLLGN